MWLFGLELRPLVRSAQRSTVSVPMYLLRDAATRDFDGGSLQEEPTQLRRLAAFELLSALDAQRSVRNRVQPRLADGARALFAFSEHAIFDLLDCRLDRFQRDFVRLH